MPFYESSRRPATGEFKRLQFLLDLIGLTGVGYDEIASKLGLSRPVIYSAMKEDDMNLSRAEAICQILGCEVSFSLFKPGSNAYYQLNGKEILLGDGQGYKLKRLAFLSAYLESKGISRTALAEKLCLGWSTVATWFRNDDIKISRLFQIAKVLGTSVGVNMLIQGPADDTSDIRQYAIDIKQSRSIPLD